MFFGKLAATRTSVCNVTSDLRNSQPSKSQPKQALNTQHAALRARHAVSDRRIRCRTPRIRTWHPRRHVNGHERCTAVKGHERSHDTLDRLRQRTRQVAPSHGVRGDAGAVYDEIRHATMAGTLLHRPTRHRLEIALQRVDRRQPVRELHRHLRAADLRPVDVIRDEDHARLRRDEPTLVVRR